MAITIVPSNQMKRVKINLTNGTETTIDPKDNTNIEKPYSVSPEEEGNRPENQGTEGKE